MTRFYSNGWYAQGLRKAIEVLEAPERRQPATTDEKPQARHLNRRLSPETISEIANAYRGGATSPELCRRYCLSKSGVLKLLADQGVVMRPRGLTDEQADLAVRLYGEGHSLKAIGQQLDKAKSSVREALMQRDVTMRPATKPKRQR